jgi:hypothetical protein
MDILALFNVGSNLMFSLGILFILIFTIFYIRQRLSDYDNKINSMFQLVSKMANEIRNLKTPLPPIYENEELSNFKTDELKVVSMNVNDEYDEEYEEDEEDEEDIENDEQQETNENNTDEYDNTDDLENKEDFEDEQDMTTQFDDNSILTSNLQKELEASIDEDLIEEDLVEESEELAESGEVEEEEQMEENVRVVDFDTTLESKVQDVSVPNYKKLKFDELKSLVSTKGLASEIQKMKKADLVTLLEDDFRKQHNTSTEEIQLM